MSNILRLNNILAESTVNGPGNRFVIWVQGCPFNCEGCFNQETHDFNSGFDIATQDLADKINQIKNIRGITLTGGEPLLQLEAINNLLDLINKNLDVLLFSGFSFDEVLQDKAKKQLLHKIDAALLGRYNNKLPHSFYGKKLVLNGSRILKEELLPWQKTEMIIDNNNVFLTGLYKKGK